MSARQKFNPRTIRLTGPVPLETAMNLLRNVPIDPDKPLTVTVGEEKKVRGLDQNAAYWAGPLRDIAEQGWIGGRQYSDIVLHEHFKREFLPEDDDPELAELAKDGYRKWDYTPDGERVLVGSTTQLTPKGMGRYMEQVTAFGASLGVMFSAPPNRMAA